MKRRYFIPLFAAVSFLLMFLHVVLVSFSASLSLSLLRKEYGIYNLVIIKLFTVSASILAGFLVAFPMAYFTRMGKSLVGFALPLFGFAVVFTPWHQESIELLRFIYLDWIFLFASCAVFWHTGRKVRSKREQATSGQAK